MDVASINRQEPIFENISEILAIRTLFGKLCSYAKSLQISIFFNPLLSEFCFPLIFEMYRKMGSYRLPTHRCGAHRKFSHYPFLFQSRNFGQTYLIIHDGQ